MINKSLQDIEQQKLAQLQGIHFQLSRIADILGRKHGEPAFVDIADLERQVAVAQRRQ